MKPTHITCFAAAFACTVLVAACTPPATTARRTSTMIRTDPRTPEDTNLIMPPVPVAESAAIPRDRRPTDDER